MTRTDFTASTPGFIADPASIDLNTGRQVSWDDVPDSYLGDDGKKQLPAGTIVSELSNPAGKIVPRADEVEYAGAAIGILRTAAVEDDDVAAMSGYGVIVGGVIFQNLLPDFGDGAIATMKTELNAVGVGNFVWETYADTRAE